MGERPPSPFGPVVIPKIANFLENLKKKYASTVIFFYTL